ncbi:unnamed protein product [Lathyrus oleraceus]|uniref:Uncharacterized protein n=1 Tax=Pisum sativum TaxID=3888 RepID=A0A9D4X6X0_PEA|nr:uncharacterized protein LOC127073265 isoform X1 [Pisum sativum]KAI5415709.1 hypothetical protein KIW84_040934 [Pisum sativum]
MIMIADTVTVIAAKSICILRGYQFSVSDSSADQISAMIHPCDAVAPPPVKPSTHRTPRRTLTRRKRRTRRKLSGDDSGGEGLFFGDGGDGVFGSGSGGFGGGGGGGGGDWNFNRFGEGDNWDERSSLPDPAFDFVYQVLSWIMLSNCLHFAFKKIVRMIVDSDREKVPTRLTPIC